MADLIIADVSEFQDVNWPAYGSDAVICRINYGNTSVDKKADINIDGARSRCKARGWYTYLIQNQDPVAQADVLVRVLQAHGGLRPNEFIVCDDEEGTGDQSSRVTAFLNEVDRLLNVNDAANWWYSGLTFATTHNMDAAKGHRWIAAYGQGEPTASHDLWQYTSSGSMAGISGNVDLSVFHGDINQFISFVGGNIPVTGGTTMGALSFRPGGPNDRWDWVFTISNPNVNGGISLGHAWGDSISGLPNGTIVAGSGVGYQDCGAPTLPDGVSLVPGTAEISWDAGGNWDLVIVQASDGSWWMFYGDLAAVSTSGWQRAFNYNSLVPATKGATGAVGPAGPAGPATLAPHTHQFTGTVSGPTDSGTAS